LLLSVSHHIFTICQSVYCYCLSIIIILLWESLYYYHLSTTLFLPVNQQVCILSFSHSLSSMNTHTHTNIYIHTHTHLRGLTDCTLDHRSLPPEFESWREHIWRLFHLWLHLCTKVAVKHQSILYIYIYIYKPFSFSRSPIHYGS